MNNLHTYQNTYVSQHNLVITFAWMTLGLIITGFTSILFALSGLFVQLLMVFPYAYVVLIVIQIALTIGMGVSMRSATATLIKVFYLIYAVTFGISLSSIAYVYSLGTISMAFFVAAAYFICLTIIGITTKKDFTKIGTLCIASLIALVITQLLLTLFRVSIDDRLVCLIGLLIFTGITIYDVQRVNRLVCFDNGDVVSQEKISIFLALQLYLDFINIFLYILRFLGSRRK